MINNFKKEPYQFLSNFYPAVVKLGGEEYPTVEHAYQAAKTLDILEQREIQYAPTPGLAKRLGKKVTIRPAWNSIKIKVMRDLLIQKFRYPDLKQKLLDTGDEQLVEGNWWGDTFWGVCNNKGSNHLGKLLMDIRYTYQILQEK